VIRMRRPCATGGMYALLNTVRARGLRVSATRRAVLAALDAAERPLTAGEIAGGALDVASVYRNLEALEAIGVVRHVHLGRAGRYELHGRTAAWATCEACGRSAPLGPGALAGIRAAVDAACGFDACFGHVPITGRCPDCRAS
jgi:Fur family transcriptional regulator, ferric uptake regulator